MGASSRNLVIEVLHNALSFGHLAKCMQRNYHLGVVATVAQTPRSQAELGSPGVGCGETY